MKLGYLIIVIHCLASGFLRWSADGQAAATNDLPAAQQNHNPKDDGQTAQLLPRQNHEGVRPETINNSPQQQQQQRLPPSQQQLQPELQLQDKPDHQQQNKPDNQQNVHQHPQNLVDSMTSQQGGVGDSSVNVGDKSVTSDSQEDVKTEENPNAHSEDDAHRNWLKKRENHAKAENINVVTGVEGAAVEPVVENDESVEFLRSSAEETKHDKTRVEDKTTDRTAQQNTASQGQEQSQPLEPSSEESQSDAQPVDVASNLKAVHDQNADTLPPYQPQVIVPDVKVREGEAAAEAASSDAQQLQIPDVIYVPPTSDSASSVLQEQQQKQEEQTPPSQFQSPPTVQIPSTQGDVKPSLLMSSKLQQVMKEDDSSPLAPGSGGMVVDDTVDFEEDGVGDVEEIQTYGEWRKKVLEEELEKENEKVKQKAIENTNREVRHTVTPMNSLKLRINYAADKCGSKVIAYNPEMENSKYMLTASKDEYMINPCSAKKWFVVELCEPISVKVVEIASLELFSSRPKSFRLLVSDRYPSREWLEVGTFEMTPDKMPQSFPLAETTPFVKFLSVEMLDHYGTEHFCPITFFRVFGLPMEEDESDDDDNIPPHTQRDPEDEDIEAEGQTLFARTKDTVVNLVKKILHSDKGHPEDGGGVEKHVNGSNGEPNMPCDPEIPQKVNTESLSTKSVEGVQATVFQPHPTVQDTPVSAVPKELPLVTKLDDTEQEEIEKKTRQDAAKDDLVILIESGITTSGWELGALKYCIPKHDVLQNTCCYNPACLFVETMLGSSAPLCLKKMSWGDFVVSRIRSVNPADDLEPSFSSTVTRVDELESTTVEVGSQETVPASIQSSTEGLKQQTVKSASIGTMHIPDLSTTDSLLSRSPVPSVKDMNTEPAMSSGDTSAQPGEHSSVTESSSVVPEDKTTVKAGASKGQMVETDPGIPSTAGGEGEPVPTTQAADAETAPREEVGITSQKQSVDLDTEILQPSEKLDTTSVESPTLTRPTPVLEMSGASEGGEREKGEIAETIMPSLSPSPTSEMPDAAEELPESDAYPQLIMPTVEEVQTVEQTEAPEPAIPEEAPTSTDTVQDTQKLDETMPPSPPLTVMDTTPGLPLKNETEKKGMEQLVHVPLTLSAKRESTIMRLTNRLKTLELNVSLSGRFLEELSARFKKQNEEMMKMLNKTINKLNISTTQSNKQHSMHEMRIEQLETRLDNLTAVVQTLADKFDAFTEQISDRQMAFTTVNLLFLIICMFMMVRASHSQPLHPDVQFLLDTMPRRPPPATAVLRRNSETALQSHTPHGMRKGGSAANLASAPVLQQFEAGHKKKKRKKHKASKSLDTESIGGTDSDPGFKTSSSGQGFSHSPKLGHRRWGSATASFPLVETVPQCVPEGKEVVFSIGSKPIQTTEAVGKPSYHSIDPDQSLSLPYVIEDHRSGTCTCPTLDSHSMPNKPPAGRYQRSKSLTTSPSPDLLGSNPLVHGGGGGGGSGGRKGGSHADDDRLSTSSWEERWERDGRLQGVPCHTTSPHLSNHHPHSHSHANHSHCHSSQQHAHTAQMHSHTTQPHSHTSHPHSPAPYTNKPHQHSNKSHSHTQSAHTSTTDSHLSKGPSWFSIWPKHKQPASQPSSMVNGARERRGKADSAPPPSHKPSNHSVGGAEDRKGAGPDGAREGVKGKGSKRSFKGHLF